ncbi:MAG: HYR domain-containing protein [Saprospiraceae bacterium]
MDNCAINLSATFSDVESGMSNCGGPAQINRTWTVIDGCGGSSTGTQIISFADSPIADFTVPDDVTINCEDDPDDLNLTGDVTDENSSCNPGAQATYSDNTSGLNGCNETGVIIRTWTLDDGCSGIVTEFQTITVVDNANPTFTTPSSVTISCEENPNDLNITGDVTDEADNCSINLEATFNDNTTGLNGCSGTGQIIRTWTLSDACNNTSTGVQIITVVDNTDPTFTVPPATVINCEDDPGDVGITGDVTDEADNCSVGLDATFNDDNSGLTGCNGTGQIIRTWTLSDDCNNTSTGVQIITVVDNSPPTFTAPSDIVLNCNVDYTDLTITGDVNNESDNCSAGLNATFSDIETGSTVCGGPSQVERVWTLTDACGQTTTISQIITLVDNQPPSFTVPDDVTLSCEQDPSDLTLTGDVLDESSDCTNDPLDATFVDDLSGLTGCNGTGDIIRTWTLDDGCSTPVTQVQVITIVDNTAPTFSVPADVTIECGESTDINETGDVTDEADNCSINLEATFTDNIDGLTACSGTGQIIRTWTLTDDCNNATTFTQTITIADNTAPTFTAPAAITVSCEVDVNELLETGEPTDLADVCDADPIATFADDDSGLIECNGTGTIIRTWSVSDACGNAATATQTITVIDEINPTFTVPANTSINCNEDYTDLTITGDVTDEADNCSTDLMATFNDATSGTSACGGPSMVTRTWTLTDDCGNTVTAEQIIMLIDTDPPSFTVPGPVEISCEDDPTDLTITGDVTDESSTCNPNAEATFSDDLSGLTGCNGTGTIARTWTLDDGCSGSVSQTQIITVVDNTAPTFTAPTDMTLTCEQDVMDLALTGDVTDESDNCDTDLEATFTDDNTALTGCNGTGTITRTWTLSDECGNVNTATQIITIVDETAPTFTVPGDVTLPCAVDYTNVAITGDVIDESDNCDTDLEATFSDENSGTSSCNTPSQVIRTWTLTDDCGNTTTATQTITLEDEIPGPSAPPAVTINCEDDPTDLSLTGNVTNWSACNPSAVATFEDDENGLVGCNGTGLIIRTWTFDDGCSPVTTDTQIITVEDNTAPTFSAPADATVSCESIDDLSLTGDVTNEADNCDTDLEATYEDDNSGLTGCSGTGEIIRTWTLTDDCGNSTSATQIVTVVDNTPPTFTVPASTTIDCNDDYTDLTATGDVTDEADNCDTDLEASYVDVITGGTDCNDPGQVIRTWMLTDDCGNTTTGEQTILISQGPPPSFTAPDNVTIDCDEDPNDLSLTGDVTDEMSACNPNAQATYTDDLSGLNGCNGSGQIVRTWTLDDGCSGIVNVNQLIFVVDQTAPTAICQDVTLPLDQSGFASLNIGDVDNGSFDNCQDAATLNFALSQTNFDCSQLGENVVVLTVTDNCNNSSTCIATVTIVDMMAPEIICPNGSITVEVDDGECFASGLWMPATGTDNCGVPVVTSSHNNNSTFPIGLTEVTHTATDAAGNTATCSYFITVKDSDAPILNCDPGTFQITSVGNCQASVTWNAITATDDCLEGLTVTSDFESGDLFPYGETTTVTYTATDGSGNSSTCSFDIELVDDIKPTLTCPIDVTLNGAGENCEAVFNWSPVTAEDNCPGASVVCTHISGTSFSVGTTTVICTATDAVGNMNECSFDVTVEDNTAPVPTCVDMIEVQIDGEIISDPSGIITDAVSVDACESVTITYTLPTAVDECSGSIIAGVNVSIPSGSTLEVGDYTVEYSFTDAAGNTSTCDWLLRVLPLGLDAVNIVPLSNTTLCEGADLMLTGSGIEGTYTWTDPSNNSIVLDTIPVVNLGEDDGGIYSLSVTTAEGCIATDAIEITVNPAPDVSIEGDAVSCDGDVSLTALTALGSEPVTNWEWTGPCGFTSDLENIELTGLSDDCAGTYTVTATTSEECSITESIPVTIALLESPALTMACDSILCISENCFLLGTDYATGPDSYHWLSSANGGLPNETNQSSIEISPTETGDFTYQYWVTVDGCETDTASITLSIVDRPEVNDDQYVTDYQSTIEIATITDNDIIIDQLADDVNVYSLPSNGTLSSTPEGTYLYTPNDGFIGSDFFLYRICYNCDASECDTARVDIRVDFTGDCEVPNIITPNGDGFNDALEISCLTTGDYPESELLVMNQWGDKVFQASPYENDWEGTLNGKEGKGLPDATYYFIFKESPDAPAMKGYIMIHR